MGIRKCSQENLDYKAYNIRAVDVRHYVIQYSIRLAYYLTWALLLFTSIRCLIIKHEIFTYASFQTCK